RQITEHLVPTGGRIEAEHLVGLVIATLQAGLTLINVGSGSPPAP
ncbi:MAG: hypothetical protein JWR37_688, partial [Mycobacterium sp.]|nr:hypothetical protein [Mycobacterium sp.]